MRGFDGLPQQCNTVHQQCRNSVTTVYNSATTVYQQCNNSVTTVYRADVSADAGVRRATIALIHGVLVNIGPIPSDTITVMVLVSNGYGVTEYVVVLSTVSWSTLLPYLR
jgi:hypothetical protein